jgi:uncharacterized DUF497 family protein
MKITFDPAKDAINQTKHGISLQDAALLDWDSALVDIDSRMDYGEVREIAYVLRDSRLYIVVFARRDDALRIISLRKANSREVKYYVDQN